MTWIKEGNLFYEERTIESQKSDVFDKHKAYCTRLFAIKKLEKLLNKEDFKEIQAVKDDINFELDLLFDKHLAQLSKQESYEKQKN